MLKVSQDKTRLEELLKNKVEENCPTGLVWLMFHMVHHVREDVEKFGSLNTFTSSQYERYVVHIKNLYPSTSQKRQEQDGTNIGNS